MFWWLVERTYQLAYERGVFLNSESIIKVYGRACRIDADSVTLMDGDEEYESEDVMFIEGEVKFLLGTVGRCLRAAGLTDSLRALGCELIAADGEVSYFLEPEDVGCAGVGSFREVCKQEMRERLTEEYVRFG